MVFNLDTTQDSDDSNPSFPPTPSSSPSVTLCRPTFTKTIVRRLVAAGASLVLTAPAFEPHDDEIPEQYAETPFQSINFDVRPEIHKRELKEFALKELRVATQNFSDKKIIGCGGFGNVYKGLLPDGSLVAIKRLKEASSQGELEFEKELKVGSIIPSHGNLLPILGYSRTPKWGELLLVYPLMINRSVDTKPQLDWSTRRKIAMGAARGLLKLHDLNIVHRDIKPSNILLDEEFEPHIGDFGLAKFRQNCPLIEEKKRGPNLASYFLRYPLPFGRGSGCAKFIHRSHLVDSIDDAPVLLKNESEATFHGQESCDTNRTTRLCGTHGYMAPEYCLHGRYSVKTDVYAFGMVLLELVTGKKAYEELKRMSLPDWVKGLLVERRLEMLVDPHLQVEYDEEEMEKVMKLGLLCTRPVPRERPYMAQVVQILEGHSIEERWEEYRNSEEFLTPVFPTYCHSGEVPSSSLLSPEELSSLLDPFSFSSLISPEELSGPR